MEKRYFLIFFKCEVGLSHNLPKLERTQALELETYPNEKELDALLLEKHKDVHSVSVTNIKELRTKEDYESWIA